MMTTTRTPDWDPWTPPVLDDQRHAYDDMRRRCPVAYSDLLGWSLFRYYDVLRAVEDPSAFSSVTKRHAIPNGLDARSTPPTAGCWSARAKGAADRSRAFGAAARAWCRRTRLGVR